MWSDAPPDGKDKKGGKEGKKDGKQQLQQQPDAIASGLGFGAGAGAGGREVKESKWENYDVDIVFIHGVSRFQLPPRCCGCDCGDHVASCGLCDCRSAGQRVADVAAAHGRGQAAAGPPRRRLPPVRGMLFPLSPLAPGAVDVWLLRVVLIELPVTPVRRLTCGHCL